MDHVALDRPRANDRNFDDEIVEAAWAKAREHVHLRPALDLEHAERIALAQHVIDPRLLARDRRQLPPFAMMRLDQVERLADTGQHAERQHVDLEDAELLDVVLVPFDEGAIVHRAIADGHGLDQRLLGQDESADMLRQMARHADQLAREEEHAAEVRVGKIEPGLGHAIILDLRLHHPPMGRGDRGSDVFRQPHHLADLADCRARAVVDHRRGDPGAVAAIFPVDVLDHLLAPLMFEVDVDVGRLLALLGDEAFEQERVGRGIDRGDAEAIADRAVRRRAATLAQDRRVEASGEGDDVVDGQKIAREVELFDEGELVFQLCHDRIGQSVRPVPRGALPGQLGQIFLGAAAVGDGLAGIFIFEFVEAEVECVGEGAGGRDGVGPAGEQALHFGG